MKQKKLNLQNNINKEDNKMMPWEKTSKNPLFNEFYTTRETCEIIFSEMIDIINEQSNNKQLKVCCPCDSEKSEIPKYLIEHTNWEVDYFSDLDVNGEEARNIMLEADIIITNPPFDIKIWRPFVKWLIENKKQFFIFGPILQSGSRKLLKLISENSYIFSPNKCRSNMYTYNRPDGSQKYAATIFYTSYKVSHLDYTYRKSKEPIETYNGVPVYNRLNNIPKDYMDWMYVPITSLHYLQPFEMDETKPKVPGKYVRIYLRRKAI